MTIQGIVVDTICSQLKESYIERCIESFPRLVSIPLADEDSNEEIQEVHVLIGLDHYYDIINGKIIRGKSGPIAVGSKFGFILSGAINGLRTIKSSTNLTHLLKIDDISNEEIYNEVKKFWEIESIGVKDEMGDEFKVNLEKRSDRYYVGLPWKDDHAFLCDNYDTARKRLICNLSILQKNQQLKKDYCEVMKNQEKLGIIEEVEKENVSPVGRTYYMPHAVLRRNKETTKTRIVFDGSSKGTGPSLNDCLHSGITTFTDLFSTLLRFYYIGMLAVIEKAFLSIGIRKEERDALRFLWVKDIDEAVLNIRHMRFTSLLWYHQ